jgi:predicted amidophosphoribosyltransferase
MRAIVAVRASAATRCPAGFQEMLAELVALLVPPRCAACRAPAPRAADPLCGACRRALPWLPSQLCERCALPDHGGRRCPARHAAFDAAWAAVAYDGAARDALHALKFAGARPLAAVMAAQIAAAAPPRLLAGPGATFVPVPAHPGRRRARGYDQAELLARALARRSGLPLRCILLRRGAARQVGASASVRRAPGRLAISARAAAPATALLVDDVHTTGATLEACAVALKCAGAARVVALTWARTLDNRPVDSSDAGRTIDPRTSFSTERTPT